MPAIIKWPKGIPAGQVRKQLATGCDWFPTIASLCGVDLPKRRIDGKDLSQVLLFRFLFQSFASLAHYPA